MATQLPWYDGSMTKLIKLVAFTLTLFAGVLTLSSGSASAYVLCPSNTRIVVQTPVHLAGGSWISSGLHCKYGYGLPLNPGERMPSNAYSFDVRSVCIVRVVLGAAVGTFACGTLSAAYQWMPWDAQIATRMCGYDGGRNWVCVQTPWVLTWAIW